MPDDDIYAVPKSLLDSPDLPLVTQQVIRELRAMAEGKGAYRRFRYLSPEIKRVWLAAALIIEARKGAHEREKKTPLGRSGGG